MKKTVFITGATSGIGRIITEMLVKKGHTVYATGRNDSAINYLNGIGAVAYKADLTIPSQIDEVVSQLPPIDIAILNAGLGYFESAVDLADREIEQMLDVNVRAPIYLAKRLAPAMIAKKNGHFIFVGSQAGKVATKKASVYAASKHAITGFVNGLRLSRQNIIYMLRGFIRDRSIHRLFRKPIQRMLIRKQSENFCYRLRKSQKKLSMQSRNVRAK